MHQLYQYWGRGIILESSEKACLAKITQQGLPHNVWPQIGDRVTCHNNRLKPISGQLWWVSFDAGTYFLEEVIESQS